MPDRIQIRPMPDRTLRQQGVSLGPFAVTKDLVAGLGDQSLLDLLVKLLEAEAAAAGVPMIGVDAGGHQDAPDEGVDAAISWTGPPEPAGWLPRRKVLFQSKAQTMRPADIAREMRPRGTLRPIFAELAATQGAYIIFSSDDSGLKAVHRRTAAMAEAISGLSGGEGIHLDFYAADRIARWANQHPGVALWLLEQSGRPLTGWQSYGPWSAPFEDDRFLVDSPERVSIASVKMTVGAAIAGMRSTLAKAGGSVRLVGRSGMGKTRLAEALFDPAVEGGVPLHRSLAIYADATHELSTSPALIAEKLAASRVEAILILDNCPAKLHSQLAEILRRHGGAVRLLTIDFDLVYEETIPTELISLGPSSDELLEELLERRFGELDSASCRRLARFSEGNARVALAIASRAKKGADLAPLNDRELLERLFQTGRAVDLDARSAAGAASLVIAFHVDETGQHQSEYATLAEIAGLTPARFYRAIHLLLDWGIAQKRGGQRAIKPDPIANHLAIRTLAESDPDAVVESFCKGPPRLLGSLARRLGQVGSSPAARRIAERLLASGGWLAALRPNSSELYSAFEGIIPAAPEAALGALSNMVESLLDGRRVELPFGYRETTVLLAIIASLPETFRNAMLLLARLSTVEPRSEGIGEAQFQFLSKFATTFENTHASENQIREIIEYLFADPDDRMKELALQALEATLERRIVRSGRSVSEILPDMPRTNEIIYTEWARRSLARLAGIAASDDPYADRARDIIASTLPGNITTDSAGDFMNTIQAVAPEGAWNAGWKAAAEALLAVEEDDPRQVRGELIGLRDRFSPRTLETCFASFVLGDSDRPHVRTGKRKWIWRNVDLLARATGRAASNSAPALGELIALATGAPQPNRSYYFGEGVAWAAPDIAAAWDLAYRAYGNADSAGPPPALLMGMMSGANRSPRPGHRDWANRLLNRAAHDPVLEPWIGAMHSGRTIGLDDIARLRQAAQNPDTPSQILLTAIHPLSARPEQQALAHLLDSIVARKDGAIPTLRVLHRQVTGHGAGPDALSSELLRVAHALLIDRRCYLSETETADDMLADVAKHVFAHAPTSKLPIEMCRRVREACLLRDFWSERGQRKVVDCLLECYPSIALDEFVGPQPADERDDLGYLLFGGAGLNDDDRYRVEFEGQPNDAVIRTWIEVDPQPRIVRLARLIRYCSLPGDEDIEDAHWTRLASMLLELAPDPVSVLRAFESRMVDPGHGDRELKYIRRRSIAEALSASDNIQLRLCAAEIASRLQRLIETARREPDEGAFE